METTQISIDSTVDFFFFFKVVCSHTGIDVFMHWSQNKNRKNTATTTDTDRQMIGRSMCKVKISSTTPWLIRIMITCLDIKRSSLVLLLLKWSETLILQPRELQKPNCKISYFLVSWEPHSIVGGSTRRGHKNTYDSCWCIAETNTVL